jgi:hypothetical protein
MARAMRDAASAPTDYTKQRAQWVEDLGGGIVSTDWYEVVGRVLPSPAAAAPQPAAGTAPSTAPATAPITPPSKPAAAANASWPT